MRFICLFVLCLIVSSCDKREVQLAETSLEEITMIRDVSPIYIFYDEASGEAEFNRNNMIGTTNWLVNIDKRNRMDSILPHLKYLQEKRKKDGIHKNDSARNYFTCSNLKIADLSFIDFSEVEFHDEPITEFLKANPLANESVIPVYVSVENREEVLIGKRLAMERSSLNKLIDDLNDLAEIDSLKNKIYMNYKGDLDFQTYIDFKTVLHTVSGEKLEIATDEFIYK